jgi:hypothetical protein
MQPIIEYCPTCGKEIVVDDYRYDDNGIITPKMIHCDRTDKPCDGAFIFRGRIETIITTSITPIPSLDIALRMNGVRQRAKTIVNLPLIKEVIKEKARETSADTRKG